MTTQQWHDANTEGEEISEFSEYKIKKNSKQRNHRDSTLIKKQKRAKHNFAMFDDDKDFQH